MTSQRDLSFCVVALLSASAALTLGGATRAAATQPLPDLAITSISQSVLEFGEVGDVAIDVVNRGPGVAGPVTTVEVLFEPTTSWFNLANVELSPGWTCANFGVGLHPAVRCDSTDPVPSGGHFPPLVMPLRPTFVGPRSFVFTVATFADRNAPYKEGRSPLGDANEADNVFPHTLHVIDPVSDVAIELVPAPSSPSGDAGASAHVRSLGPDPAHGSVVPGAVEGLTVVDIAVPVNAQIVSATSPAWFCSAGQPMRCRSAWTVLPNGSFPVLDLVVRSPGPAVVRVTVTHPYDPNPANNAASATLVPSPPSPSTTAPDGATTTTTSGVTSTATGPTLSGSTLPETGTTTTAAWSALAFVLAGVALVGGVRRRRA